MRASAASTHLYGPSILLTSFATSAFITCSPGQHWECKNSDRYLILYIISVPRPDAMKILCTSNSWMYTFFQNTSLAFNLCLCHDLVRTLKNPFQPQGRRMKFYAVFSLISASAFSIASQSTIMSIFFLFDLNI